MTLRETSFGLHFAPLYAMSHSNNSDKNKYTSCIYYMYAYYLLLSESDIILLYAVPELRTI